MQKRLFTLLIILFISLTTSAQTFPVISTTQIIPPYSVYLSDYASPSSDKLIANLMLQDQNQSGIQVKLKITITGDNGVKLETKPEYMPPPITLYAGTPEQISGFALQQYLEPANLNITGLNVAQFMQSKKLPEGIYTFTVQAVEYRRNKLVSNSGTAVAWLILNDPPIWNLPQHNTTITATNPQNIFFSWFPMHRGSPNSAFTTEYEFSLYDLIPQNTNPDNFVNTANPIYQTTTTGNSLVYGSAELPLEVGRKYACRLRAYDTEGRDMFKNNGFSTILVFTYGQECITPVGINCQDITPFTANISWTAIPGNTEFELYYREKTNDPNSQWYVGTTPQTSATINQLKPQHTYQYVLRALCGTLESEPSAIYEFTTVEKITDTLICDGSGEVPEIDGSPPLEELYIGDIINVGGFEGIITQARGSGGIFSGKCIMRLTNFNILLKSHFDDISINQSYQVTAGTVIADRGPGIMINLDNVINTLDSLANIEIDTTIINNPDDYLEDLEIVYDLDPVIITDSIAENLEEIADDLEELLGSGDLTEQQQAIEDLLEQIETLLSNKHITPCEQESENFGLNEINFINSKNIYKDNGDGLTYYEKPDWQAGRQFQNPVTYNIGKPIIANIKLYVNIQDTVEIHIQATGKAQLDTTLTYISNQSNIIEIQNLKLINRYKTIDIDTLIIHWKFEIEDMQLCATDTSENKIYVTLNQVPENLPLGFVLFETVLHIGCNRAKGMNTTNSEQEITDKIFEEFEQLQAKNYLGEDLHYYEDPYQENSNVAGLLKDKDAQCYAFSSLFRDILTAQGISTNGDYTITCPFEYEGTLESFLIKDWSFESSQSKGLEFSTYDLNLITDAQWTELENLYGGEDNLFFDRYSFLYMISETNSLIFGLQDLNIYLKDRCVLDLVYSGTEYSDIFIAFRDAIAQYCIRPNYYPHINISATNNENSLFDNDNNYAWIYTDVQQTTPLPGQNNYNPKSNFDYHYVLKVGDYIYDASYGKKYIFQSGSDNEIKIVQDSSISAFYMKKEINVDENVFGDINNNGIIENNYTRFFFFIRQPLNQTEFKIEQDEY